MSHRYGRPAIAELEVTRRDIIAILESKSEEVIELLEEITIMEEVLRAKGLKVPNIDLEAVYGPREVLRVGTMTERVARWWKDQYKWGG